MVTTDIAIQIPEPLAPSSGLVGTHHQIGWLFSPESFQQNSHVPTVGTDGIQGTKKMDWLENLDSSVSLDDGKVAQLIGNREKQNDSAKSENFFRQKHQNFSANKV